MLGIKFLCFHHQWTQNNQEQHNSKTLFMFLGHPSVRTVFPLCVIVCDLLPYFGESDVSMDKDMHVSASVQGDLQPFEPFMFLNPT